MKLPAFLCICLLVSLGSVRAQLDKSTFGSEPIILKHADSLLGTTSEAGAVRRVKGNVTFLQGNVTVTCSEAIQYLDQNRVELSGNVVINQGTVTLRTPHGEYNGNTRTAFGRSGVTLTDRDTKLSAIEGFYSTADRIADFYRNVVVENDSMLVYSDTLKYLRDSQNSFANGSVSAFGKYESVRLYGDSLSNFPSQRYMRVAGGTPLFCRIDTVKKQTTDTAAALAFDTLCISGTVLEAFRDVGNERYIATGNMRLTRGSLAARSTIGTYSHSFENIQLQGAPVIWMDSTQLSGDSIAISLRNQGLERIAAFRNAFAATKSDTVQGDRIHQITGDNIFIAVSKDTLRRITAENKAFSLYFLYKEGTPDGVSRSSADMITIDLEHGQASNVHWTGKVDGEYLPEAIISNHLNEFNLRNFRWLTNRPSFSLAGLRIPTERAPVRLENPGEQKRKK